VAAHRSWPQPPDHRTLAELTVRAGHSALLDVEPLDLGPGAPATVAPALVAGAMLETSPRFTPVAALDAAVDPSSESWAPLSPLALAMGKRVLNQAYEAPLGSDVRSRQSPPRTLRAMAIRGRPDRPREARDIAAERVPPRAHERERLDQRPPPDPTAGIE
jgi:hypothetical protein